MRCDKCGCRVRGSGHDEACKGKMVRPIGVALVTTDLRKLSGKRPYLVKSNRGGRS